MKNLSESGDYQAEIKDWRDILMRELDGRPEGFTDGKRLNVLGKATPECLPGFEQELFV